MVTASRKRLLGGVAVALVAASIGLGFWAHDLRTRGEMTFVVDGRMVTIGPGDEAYRTLRGAMGPGGIFGASPNSRQMSGHLENFDEDYRRGGAVAFLAVLLAITGVGFGVAAFKRPA